MEIRTALPSQIPEDWYDSLVGFDIETEDLPINSPICLVSIHKPKSGVILVIPIHVYRRGICEDIEPYELEILKGFISRMKVAGANLQFDMARTLYHWGVRAKEIYMDTFILARILQLEKQGLKDMALRVKPELTSVLNKFTNVMGDKPPFYYNIEDPAVVRYSGLDAYLPFVVIQGLSPQIKKVKNIINIEQDFLDVAIQQNYKGLNFNLDRFDELVDEYSNEVKLKNRELDELVGWHVRCNATADKKKLFVEKYGCTSSIKTPKGEISMSADSLAQMAENDDRPEVVDLLRRVIEINKMFSVYNSSKKVPDFIVDGNLHFNIEQIGYDGTARVYSKDFSVNQLSKKMREAVIPDKGKKFLYFDYKAAELFIALVWSGCRKGIEWYNSGKDLHTEVMKIILGKENVTKEDRNISKVLSFSQIYGGTEYTIARDLNCDIEYAEQLARDYQKLFPEIVQLRNHIYHYAHQNEATKTIVGRFRKLPKINSSWQLEREKSERQSFNTAVQSSCADLMKIAASRCYKEFSDRGVRVAFTVFDSFLLEIPEEMTEEQYKPILERMSDFSDIMEGLKLRYDYSEGYSWKECQDKV